MTLTAERKTPGTQSKQSPAACQHHWVIEPTNNPTANGVCRLCRATREFDNGRRIPGQAWGTNHDWDYIFPADRERRRQEVIAESFAINLYGKI
ncbi:MAG: hypothetical protein WC359_14760 [Dehalococcoidia bacterium]|jgi:hypothetical protein